MENKTYNSESGRKFNIPPIAFIIASAVIIIGCVIGICSVYFSFYEDENFKNSAGTADAVCTDKTVYVDGNNYALIKHYVMVVQFYTEDDENGELYQGTLDESNVYFENIEIGDTIQLYYDREDPTICHPTILYGDATPYYVIFAIIIVAAFILALVNLNTFIRNIHGYTPKYTKPNDIETLGEDMTENGLTDNNINYNSTDVFSDKLMDSYVDPFVSYSGYEDGEENQEIMQGEYYDPNLNSGGAEEFNGNSDIPHDVDINNPFVTNVYSDPNDKNTEWKYDDSFSTDADGTFSDSTSAENDNI